MYKKYVAPVTDVVNLNLLNSVLGPGDVGGSGPAEDNPWANTMELDLEEEVDNVQATSKSLWD